MKAAARARGAVPSGGEADGTAETTDEASPDHGASGGGTIRCRPGSAHRPAVPLVALLLALVLSLAPARALAWPWAQGQPLQGTPGTTAARRAPGVAASDGNLQEVAPPAAVLQLSEALAARRPRVTILEPQQDALLGDAPWTLRLAVEDWPLVDAGPLGLGPHLRLQLDDQPPQVLLQTSVTLPPLSPGSHRLTVYAARPWGEAVKAPGAFSQIRLHRTARNPLALPAPGTPQLLAVSPLTPSPAEPILLDWLLIDAPLQNLRAEDARWRLRLTVNGDSLLLNQQTPLWLRGWQPGVNALLLELVDGRGEPLNPPFNSLVREVNLDRGAPRPVWLGSSLAPAERAALLGEAPAPSQAGSSTEPITPPVPGAKAPAGSEQALEAPAADLSTPPSPGPTPALPEERSEPGSDGPPADAEEPGSGLDRERESSGDDPLRNTAETEPQAPESSQAAENTPRQDPQTEQTRAGEADATGAGAVTSPAAPTEISGREGAEPARSVPGQTAAAAQAEAPQRPADPPLSGPEEGMPPPRPAREEVNPDGTLIRPEPTGPWQSLKKAMSR